jgi:hypothetical protein
VCFTGGVEMDFEMKLAEGGKIGIIASHIKITKEGFEKLLTEVIQFKEKHNVDLVIYDVHEYTLEMPTFEQYDFVYNISSQFDIKMSRKIALLVKEDDHSYDFIETLYLNSGRVMKRFENYDEAVSWLIKC